MNLMFRFLLAALAAWRLAFLLVREDGPGIFSPAYGTG